VYLCTNQSSYRVPELMKLDEEFSVHVIHMNLQHMYFTVMYSSIIIFAVFLSSFSILVL
jgi:hypothetical protein